MPNARHWVTCFYLAFYTVECSVVFLIKTTRNINIIHMTVKRKTLVNKDTEILNHISKRQRNRIDIIIVIIFRGNL